jgi:hypothetical protein
MLNPVLTPLGFAPAQGGAGAGSGQVIFCRGFFDSADEGCVDLVIDFEEAPQWHIVAVRYWGFPADRWKLDFPREGSLVDQLSRLAQTLPLQLDS